MKKIIKIIVLIFLSILIISLSIFFYLKYQHSLAKVAELFNRKNDIPDNVYIKKESTDNAGTRIKEIYKKDKIIYIKDYSEATKEDIIYDYEKMESFTIEENGFLGKKIELCNIEGEGLTNGVNYYFYGISEKTMNSEEKYKYYGKENIDGIDCIRFSLYDKDSGYLTNYYIDTKKRALYKKETGVYYNDKYTFIYSDKYTFSENTVKDEDILHFDINNYSDYKLTDYRNKEEN